jgi:hypothetical protein
MARWTSDGNDEDAIVNRPPVVLRDEHIGRDSRHLRAYLDEEGNLVLEGHDLGPGTAPVSDDGEYEWVERVSAADLPRLVELLGGLPGPDILDLLEERYRGPASYDFTQLLYHSDISVERHVW